MYIILSNIIILLAIQGKENVKSVLLYNDILIILTYQLRINLSTGILIYQPFPANTA